MSDTHINIIEAIDSEKLFKPWFKNPVSWQAWIVFLKALFALPMTDDELEIYRQHTGRELPHDEPQSEAYLCCGRRAGKSFIMALVAVYLACFCQYQQYLQPGERALILVLAADRRQARIIMRFVAGFFHNVPSLKAKVERETAEAIDLNNSVSIEVGTANTKAGRGYALAAVLADEVAHWQTDEDASDPDFAVIDSLRPGMTTIPNSLLLCGSSPYARKGLLYEAWADYWGQSASPLFWKATSREMNPTVPQKEIDRAIERDANNANAEYMAEFRNDIEAFIEEEAIDAAIEPNVYERPPDIETHTYRAFVDQAGGSGEDSMTLAIAHIEEETAVLDALREVKPPFSPEQVCGDFAKLMHDYAISEAEGDHFGGDFVAEPFRKKNIDFKRSDKTSTHNYLDFLPALNSGRVTLLDHRRLKAQFLALERRHNTQRTTIAHPKGGHDDLACATAGVIAKLLQHQTQQDAPHASSHQASYFKDNANNAPPPEEENLRWDGKQWRKDNDPQTLYERQVNRVYDEYMKVHQGIDYSDGTWEPDPVTGGMLRKLPTKDFA